MLISSVLLLTSCHKQDGINVFHSVSTKGWDVKDTLSFWSPPTMEEGDFDLSLQTRISRNYAYENLWVVVEQEYVPDSLSGISSQHFMDTVSLTLTSRSGAFTGNGKDLLEYTVPIRRLHLPQTTEAVIRLHHIMSDGTIQGVHDIGVCLTPLLPEGE